MNCFGLFEKGPLPKSVKFKKCLSELAWVRVCLISAVVTVLTFDRRLQRNARVAFQMGENGQQPESQPVSQPVGQ